MAKIACIRQFVFAAFAMSLIFTSGCQDTSDQAKQNKLSQTDMKTVDSPEISQVLFHPIHVKKVTPEGAQDFDVPVVEGVQIGCRLFLQDPASPTILFFHGNGEIVPDYDDIAPFYLAEKINFLVCDYRGYGWSGGTPLLSSFLNDANKVYLFMSTWLLENNITGPLFVMGRSIGSACAIDVAAKHNELISGLIIESGFAKTIPLAKILGLDLEAMGLEEKDTFNSGEKIALVTKPTLLLHGQYDQLIPVWQAEMLHAESGAKQKELLIVPRADHNSLIAVAGSQYFSVIRKFIEKATGTAPDWRERRKKFKEEQKNKEQS